VLDFRQPVLNVDSTTTVEAAAHAPPASLPAPVLPGGTLRSTIPAMLVTHPGPTPLLDAPMLTPLDTPSLDLVTAPSNE